MVGLLPKLMSIARKAFGSSGTDTVVGVLRILIFSLYSPGGTGFVNLLMLFAAVGISFSPHAITVSNRPIANNAHFTLRMSNLHPDEMADKHIYEV
jgi:hypothetical protein